MNSTCAIRLVASGNNERGDLFTRLAKDLFFALGYDELRLNVHKSGRELDIQGKHRLEPRLVVGECKAQSEKIGGAELNKFFGALTRERSKCAPTTVSGYFVSLGGFTETSIEQENETGDNGIILLDAQKVVDELERTRVIVGRTEAAERAGQCAHHAGLREAVLDGVELLGHNRGYVWAIFYARGKKRTHVAFIHADGTPLADVVAREVIEDDLRCAGVIHSLQYLGPPDPAPDRIALADIAISKYRQWLSEECGFIHFDGLPTDTDLSATRLKLERLFVPLKAISLPKPDDDHPDKKQASSDTVYPIGEILGTTSHLALLAMPGGGKSTLLKRLAMAYAFPERRNEVDDHLPKRNWLPLILRCRELRDRAHRPILELLDDIPRHAGMNAEECGVFQDSIHDVLRSGKAILLVDGLDEISDEGARQIFASHLRTFLAMFPQTALVVTSREAGFRMVAGVIASACVQAILAPLNEDDVLNLCERWHVEVLGDTDKVRADAKELGRTIWDNERIRTLAENPLLLTTLLVVKRCIQELPRSRIELYREAIRVLVRTWNVEGYAPMDEGETLAQLSYVACAMMTEGKQQIGQKALLDLLQNARYELDAELQFARISPQEFIERIEYRSSLLMQTGHEKYDGELQPVYEFRHLTFQEYLTARGYVIEQYPGRDSERALADVLVNHFEDERWREVIPLAAVLAGRKAEDLVKRLIAACKRSYTEATNRLEARYEPHRLLLYQCIRDEVQVTTPTLRSALTEISRDRMMRESEFGEGWSAAILRGKFGAIFQDVVEKSYLEGGPGFEDFLEACEGIALYLRFGEELPLMSNEVAASLHNDLEQGARIEKVRAALVCMWLAYKSRDERNKNLEHVYPHNHFQLVINGLCAMVDSKDLPCSLAASWVLAWIGNIRICENILEPKTIVSFYELWRSIKVKWHSRFYAWALSAQRLLPRDSFRKEIWRECDSTLKNAIVDNDGDVFVEVCALVVGWYRRSPWSDTELVEQLAKYREVTGEPTIRELLENLGDPGRLVLEDWKRIETENKAKAG